MNQFIRNIDERHILPASAGPRVFNASSFVSMLLALLSMPLPVVAVEYEVRFDAVWSAATHPGAYPIGAHFSPLIGATHNDQVTFWESGGIASAGIELMAETGGTATLLTEIAEASGDADTIILTAGLSSPGSTSTTFDIVSSHSLVTLVTMIAPSPDWFVGVTGLDLYDGGAWVPQVTVDLFAYDSGTDSGTDFTSSNANIISHIPIEMLGAPLAGAPALGTFTFTLLLPGDGNRDGWVDGLDYLLWAGNFGAHPGADGDISDGDYNDDGWVDGLDYLLWAGNYGSHAKASVPEPAALVLIALGMIPAMTARRRRRPVP